MEEINSNIAVDDLSIEGMTSVNNWGSSSKKKSIMGQLEVVEEDSSESNENSSRSSEAGQLRLKKSKSKKRSSHRSSQS